MKKTAEEMYFKLDTVALLNEIANCGLPRTMGTLKVPLNVLMNYLGQVAQRAIQLDDPEMNIIMLSMGLYDTPHYQITEAIEQQEKRKDATQQVTASTEALQKEIAELNLQRDNIWNERNNTKKEVRSLEEQVQQVTLELQKRVETALEIADNAPELNMGNYDDDQVRELNNAMIELCLLLREIVFPKPIK